VVTAGWTVAYAIYFFVVYRKEIGIKWLIDAGLAPVVIVNILYATFMLPEIKSDLQPLLQAGIAVMLLVQTWGNRALYEGSRLMALNYVVIVFQKIYKIETPGVRKHHPTEVYGFALVVLYQLLTLWRLTIVGRALLGW
jgi:hypothetical protein